MDYDLKAVDMGQVGVAGGLFDGRQSPTCLILIKILER